MRPEAADILHVNKESLDKALTEIFGFELDVSSINHVHFVGESLYITARVAKSPEQAEHLRRGTRNEIQAAFAKRKREEDFPDTDQG